MVRVSVCIPTKNGESTIEECLSSIFKQKYTDFEVNIIDSASTDSTIDIIKRYPINLSKISRQQFEHGSTRNDLARRAKGDIIVFLSQDSIPASENWLENLINPILNDKILGVSGKQLPRKNATAIEQNFCEWRFPNKEVIYTNETHFALDEILFSTANCAMEKNLLIEYPFGEYIMIQGQDKLWASQVVLKGYKILYNPAAAVRHSHPPKLRVSFKEYFLRGMSRKQILMNNLIANKIVKSDTDNFGAGLKFMVKLMQYFNREGYKKQIPMALMYQFMIFCAFLLGKHFELLPTRIVAKFSTFHSESQMNKRGDC